MKKDQPPPPDKPGRPKWLTVAEVAAELRIHVATVYRQIEKGQLPGVRIGGSIRIRADALDAYLNRSSAKPEDKTR